MRKQVPQLFAAIHLGSEQISIQIVEYSELFDIRIVDQASIHVTLGEETFKTGRISFSTVSEVCELLKGYRRMMSEYGVAEYRVVATTAVREAQNQQYIIDQIRVKTGFTVEVVDMPQEIYYKFISIIRTAEAQQLLATRQGIFFVDISSGGLGITLVIDGKIRYQQNIHIGIIRIKESFDKRQRDSVNFNQALAQYINSIISPVKQELGKYQIKYLVLSGSETDLLLKMLGHANDNNLVYVGLAELYKLYNQIQGLKLPQLIKMFDLSETVAEIVLPTIILYHEILSLIKVEELVIPPDRFIDGITKLYIAEKKSSEWLQTLEDYMMSLVKSIAEKYGYDCNHAEQVERFSLMFFDRLAKVHGLGKRERMLLKIAARLHDIGKFVSLRRHYFYSYRLILSSDIFGITEDEKKIIAFIAHYHSKGVPDNDNRDFERLSKQQQVIVAKLSALVRLADAMDRSHRKKVAECDMILKGDELVIGVNSLEDLSLEEWTFLDKSSFFEEVYGIKPLLVRKDR